MLWPCRVGMQGGERDRAVHSGWTPVPLASPVLTPKWSQAGFSLLSPSPVTALPGGPGHAWAPRTLPHLWHFPAGSRGRLAVDEVIRIPGALSVAEPDPVGTPRSAAPHTATHVCVPPAPQHKYGKASGSPTSRATSPPGEPLCPPQRANVHQTAKNCTGLECTVHTVCTWGGLTHGTHWWGSLMGRRRRACRDLRA